MAILARSNTRARRAVLRAAGAEVQAKFFRGLGDPTRLRIVRMLLNGPRSVGALVDALAMSQSRVSNHLACLKWCGYVATQRNGLSIVYRIADDRVRHLLAAADAIVADNATHVAACTRIDSKPKAAAVLRLEKVR